MYVVQRMVYNLYICTYIQSCSEHVWVWKIIHTLHIVRCITFQLWPVRCVSAVTLGLHSEQILNHWRIIGHNCNSQLYQCAMMQWCNEIATVDYTSLRITQPGAQPVIQCNKCNYFENSVFVFLISGRRGAWAGSGQTATDCLHSRLLDERVNAL